MQIFEGKYLPETLGKMFDDNVLEIILIIFGYNLLALSFIMALHNLSGFEIYAPCKCNMNFALNMAQKIKEYTNIQYSNNSAFKYQDGVYIKNYTSKEIREAEVAAKRKGYEPYNITEQTPYYYTIREVGGIATGAYVDGRNKNYNKNEYYKSCQGIECYQIELGYIKNDLNILLTEKEQITQGIADAIIEYYK